MQETTSFPGLTIPVDKTNPVYWYVVGGVIGELYEHGVLDQPTALKAFGHFRNLSIEAGEGAFKAVEDGCYVFPKVDKLKQLP